MSHSHNIYDTDKHFLIDPNTRSIASQSEKLKLMQYDHNSERFTFELPRYIEGHDMTQCNRVEVHYINVSRDRKQERRDVYEVTDLHSSPDDDQIAIFSWLITAGSTSIAGKLNFRITFKCVGDDGSIDYEWNTDTYTSISISEGISNTESVAEVVSDVLESWKASFLSNTPIKYIESLDKDDLINLIDLESGTYVLHGYFHPFAGSKTTCTFSNNLIVSIIAKNSGTHGQVLYPINNTVQFFSIMVDDTADGGYVFDRINVSLNDLQALVSEVGSLDQLITSDKTSIVAAINDVAKNESESFCLIDTNTERVYKFQVINGKLTMQEVM